MKNPNPFLNILRRYSSHSFKKQFYITSPIFYVNADPHVGHLYSVLITDAIRRSKNLLGVPCQLLTGTDEHGIKIQKAALNAKQDPSIYCDKISQRYKELFQVAQVDYDIFIRTTQQRHIKTVHQIWDILKKRDFIYEGKYSGWYSEADECFYSDENVREENGTKVATETGRIVEWTEEENFIFRLSKCRDDLLYWLKDETVIQPQKFHQEIVKWLLKSEDSTKDLSISRPAKRVHWAIPVPDRPDQNIYVWLDALFSYLTGAGYPESKWNENWPPDVQIIGKDILKFHAVYWPAFLIAAGLPPPKQLFVHSHWLKDGEKMSKTKGNIVNPLEVIPNYSISGLRYFLLREGVPQNDGNYSDEKAKRVMNSELADTFGNLFSRCCGKKINPKQEWPICSSEEVALFNEIPHGKELLQSLAQLSASVQNHFSNFEWHKASDSIMSCLRKANALFESEKPWALGPDHKRVRTLLHITLTTLVTSGLALKPFIPELSERLFKRMNLINGPPQTWADLQDVNSGNPQARPFSTQDTQPLFMRLQSPKETKVKNVAKVSR